MKKLKKQTFVYKKYLKKKKIEEQVTNFNILNPIAKKVRDEELKKTLIEDKNKKESLIRKINEKISSIKQIKKIDHNFFFNTLGQKFHDLHEKFKKNNPKYSDNLVNYQQSDTQDETYKVLKTNFTNFLKDLNDQCSDYITTINFDILRDENSIARLTDEINESDVLKRIIDEHNKQIKDLEDEEKLLKEEQIGRHKMNKEINQKILDEIKILKDDVINTGNVAFDNIIKFTDKLQEVKNEMIEKKTSL